MKVYIAKPNMEYSGGCKIIAARSIEEAKERAKDDWCSDYKVEHLPCLQTDLIIPCVIIDRTYFE